ncbi:hypothetical protein GCM10027290_61690 [Micromonospora sonneratiae]|uniref:Tetratricopeptide repeat protein n=1 Tax=Micromonospora sonneratiae TaxID=1184706 RepID=A0ABW3YM07_9ACTN
MTPFSDSGVDPATAGTPEQYVALLRQLRDRSGLSFRTIERRAKANGHVLPASTLATMLNRPTLPRRDMVVTLLQACDVSEEQSTAWLTAWGRLAAARSARTIAAGQVTPEGTDRPATQPSGPHPPGQVPPGVPGTPSPRTADTAGPAQVTTTRPVPFQLPPMPAVVIGRSHEIEQILAAMTADRAICVLEGPGGIGKSTLALHLAHLAATRYPGGCLYVDLHGASAGLSPVQPTEVLARFLRALGARTIPPYVEEASALFRTLTATQGVLVVLDNAASAAQVRPLLPSGPGCTTLITSRWKLSDLDFTARFPVGPLSEDSAITLLRHLCGPQRLDADTEAAAVIVRQCGGLPLALRIVGARAAARPELALGAFADRIADEAGRLDELQVGDLSVRTSLYLGYRAFGEAARDDHRLAARTFRLAALPDWAEATAPGCAALIGAPLAATERALEHLVDANLLESAGPDRYRFHDTVRIFARERAQAVELPSEREAAMHRLTSALLSTSVAAIRLLYPHDQHHAGLVADPTDPQLTSRSTAWAWLEREHTSLLAIARQQFAAGQSLAEIRDLALTLTRFIEVAGYVAEQAQFGELTIETAQRLDDRGGVAMGLNILAIARLRQGRVDEGIDLLERRLVIQRELHDRAGEAACLNNLGNAYRDKGHFTEALRYLQESLAIRRELADHHKEGSTLDNIGLVYQHLGAYEQAIAHHEAGLALTRQVGDRHREALMLVNLAETLQLYGENARAAEHAREALAICQEFQHQRGIGLALRTLGDAYAELGLTSEAHEYRLQALALLENLDEEAYEKVRTAMAQAHT